MDTPTKTELDALAHRVTDAYADFDARIGDKRKRFPVTQFDQLWRAVHDYCAAMKGRSWIHRNVASVVSELRVYLELEIFGTPSDIFRKVDQMECLLFSDYDAYPDD